MRLQDLHTHSIFDDGTATLEEMVCAAIEKGMSAIGFSGHAPIKNEHTWTIQYDTLDNYYSLTRLLQEKYQNKINVYCGIEYDLRSDIDLSHFDYVIGSIHSIFDKDIDNTAQITTDCVNQYFLGDADEAAEHYYSQYSLLAEQTEIDIIGHLDLITKFNEQCPLFNSDSEKYNRSAKMALEKIVTAGKIIEINTGAISRGYRSEPYPSKSLLLYLRELNGKICINSDAHSVNGIGCHFSKSLALAKECKFDDIWFLTDDGFVPISINTIELD